MFESKYNKLLTVILIIVVLGIIGLLIFLGVQYFSTSNNTKDAEDFVDDFIANTSNGKIHEGNEIINTLVNPDDNGGGEESRGQIEVIEQGGNNEPSGNVQQKVAKKTMYKDFYVDGTMEIPKIGFKYPVLEEVTKSSIETSVAVLYGAGLNQVGNTVIIGHNYRNGQFFSNLKKVENGDKIYITDYEGVRKTYTIYHHFITTPDDTSFYQRDTNGKAEVTLQTCTDDSSARLIVFASED